MHLDHLDRGVVVAPVSSAATVLQNKTLKSTVVGFSHRRMHTDIRGDPGQHNIFNATRPEQMLKICCTKASLARLVDNRLAWLGFQFVNNFPAWLTADENLAARAIITSA